MEKLRRRRNCNSSNRKIDGNLECGGIEIESRFPLEYLGRQLLHQFEICRLLRMVGEAISLVFTLLYYSLNVGDDLFPVFDFIRVRDT